MPPCSSFVSVVSIVLALDEEIVSENAACRRLLFGLACHVDTWEGVGSNAVGQREQGLLSTLQGRSSLADSLGYACI